jgi:hypothetical protein
MRVDRDDQGTAPHLQPPMLPVATYDIIVLKREARWIRHLRLLLIYKHPRQ